jgi:threonine dehydrogenase-like Zn-dependent dehydrogenase
MFEDMNRAVEATNLKPVVDKVGFGFAVRSLDSRRADPSLLAPQVFKWEDTIEAYRYLDSGKHFGKVCIELA